LSLFPLDTSSIIWIIREVFPTSRGFACPHGRTSRLCQTGSLAPCSFQSLFIGHFRREPCFPQDLFLSPLFSDTNSFSCINFLSPSFLEGNVGGEVTRFFDCRFFFLQVIFYSLLQFQGFSNGSTPPSPARPIKPKAHKTSDSGSAGFSELLFHFLHSVLPRSPPPMRRYRLILRSEVPPSLLVFDLFSPFGRQIGPPGRVFLLLVGPPLALYLRPDFPWSWKCFDYIARHSFTLWQFAFPLLLFPPKACEWGIYSLFFFPVGTCLLFRSGQEEFLWPLSGLREVGHCPPLIR